MLSIEQLKTLRNMGADKYNGQPIDFTPLDDYYADKAVDIAATGGEESELPDGWYRDDETGGLKPLGKAAAPAQSIVPKRNKYMREIAPNTWVDVYDVIAAWGIVNPAQQHLAKKALQAGGRGHKDYITDMKDIIESAERAIELEHAAKELESNK